MIRFVGGPADAVVLELQAAPVLLRVVQSKAGQWDALDQPNDQPTPDETIVVYRRNPGTVARAHLCCSPRSKSRFVLIAEYHAVQQRPADELVRDNQSWQHYCSRMEADSVNEAKR